MNTRRVMGLFLALAAATLAAQTKTKFSNSDVVGLWHGSMGDDGPTVDLQVQEDHGQLHGKMTMPMTAPGASQSSAEQEMLEPQFDGQVLSFKIKAGGQPQAYQFELDEKNAGELRPAASSEDAIKMTRVSSQ